MVRKPLVAVVLAAMLLAGVFGLSQVDMASVQAREAADKHPRIRAAIKELKEARKELDEGAKVFGGHRVKALKACDEAIDQLQKALDFADK